MYKRQGVYTGKYKLLINVPISIASAMAASFVPVLTGAYHRDDMEAVRGQINLSTRFIMVVAFPCAVGPVSYTHLDVYKRQVPIPFRIEELTSIRDDMVITSPTVDVILPQFMEFCKDCKIGRAHV